MKTAAQSEEWIPTRQSLLTRLKDWHDQEGWQDFFNTYWRLIYGVARKAGLNDAEAQDVVQETLVSVAQSMPGFKYDPARGSFKAWLLKLTQWRVTDAMRKRHSLANHHPDLADKTDLIEGVPDPDAETKLARIWDAEWEQNLMAVALERVKPHVSARNFQIYQLHVLRDWPVEKVTATLGVGRAAIYVAKCRVGARLKKELLQLRKKRPEAA